ncbi:MAG TPA: hypothetical protein VF790_00820 [Dissulfurispiraceae bacterium]
MLFFMVDKEEFVMTNVNADTIRGFWKDYRCYRYDMDLSFCEFLEENGLYVRAAPPFFNPFGYDLADIEISLN